MSLLPIDWLDAQEFAALELALAAATESQPPPSCTRSIPSNEIAPAPPWKRRNTQSGSSHPIAQSDSELVCQPIDITGETARDGSSSAKSARRLPSWTWVDVTGRSNRVAPIDDTKTVEGPAYLARRLGNAEQCTLPGRLEDHQQEGDQLLQAQASPWRIVRSGCQETFPLNTFSVATHERWVLCTDAESTKRKLPSLHFKGRIVYSNTTSDVEANSLELLQIVEARRAMQNCPIPVGFDTEWKVVFKRGALPRKVAVLQLCVDANRCDIFHIVHSGIPHDLQSLLEDPSIYKVGIGAHGDAAKLRKDYGINVKGIIDLCSTANYKLRGSTGSRYISRNWSLSALAQELTCKQVEKVGSIRTGDWEVCNLSDPQLQYAATDAFASLHLYQVLMTFPDPIIESKEEDSNGVLS